MILAFAISFFSFVALDFVWFSFVVNRFNLNQLAAIARIEDGKFQILYLPAILTYVLMAAAIAVFALPKMQSSDSSTRVFAMGALLGLIIYGVYDMTNLAILKNYPIAFVCADVAWGTVVFGVVSLITKFALKAWT